ncbi:MAG TPA: hypothetical protein VN851_15010 [Thermoanaerobaculia bacterium]|nr:hypothetical protein [Thermoanaerobaculia bacterium]
MAQKRVVRKPAKKAAKAVSKPAPAPEAGNEEGLLTLTEVSKRSNISMPTLQRYKKLYQSRIPSVGKGRKQRYLESSLAIFEELKNENIGRRGRPRKAVGKTGRPVGRPPGRPAAAKPAAAAPAEAPARRGRKAASSSGLMTLTEISKLAGVSYPTAVRYVRLFLDRLPHEGEGRRRRFYSGAVEVFNQLREEGGRGGQRVKRIAGRAVEAIESGVSDRIKQLEKAQQSFEKKLRTLAQSLQKFLE